MAFPNVGQMPASSQMGLPKRPAMPVKPSLKKAAVDPRLARQALVAGMKGC